MRTRYIKIKCKKCESYLLKGEKPIYFKTHRVCNDCSDGLKWQEKMKANALKRKNRS